MEYSPLEVPPILINSQVIFKKNLIISNLVKGKASCDGSVAFSAKRKLNDLATITVAGKVNLTEPSKALDFSKLTPFPVGY